MQMHLEGGKKWLHIPKESCAVEERFQESFFLKYKFKKKTFPEYGAEKNRARGGV